jgi:hypothetical protein
VLASVCAQHLELLVCAFGYANLQQLGEFGEARSLRDGGLALYQNLLDTL